MSNTFINKANKDTLLKNGRRLQITLFGNWDETIRVLSRLDKDIKKCSLKAQKKICQDIEKKVKRHLRNQDLNWPALNEDYAADKNKAGRDGRTLISDGQYYWAIHTWQPGQRDLMVVGVKTGIYTRGLDGKQSKTEVARIALMHEFSNGKRFPRRPLWNPTIAEMGGKNGLQELFKKHFLATCTRNGIPIVNLRNYF